MVVTDVKIKLVKRSEQKLLAFSSITLDRCFVVRDIKIIQGNKAVFVAMPSRKLMDRCGKCANKNALQALFCGNCGFRLKEKRAKTDKKGRTKLHADIAHPINAQARMDIHNAILRAYTQELERSQSPGYVPQVFDDDEGPEEDFDMMPEDPLNNIDDSIGNRL